MRLEDLEISKVITEDLIDLNLKATSKLEVIEEMTHLLYRNHCIDSEKGFIKDVLYRESQGVTGLEKGIAIPHGKSESVIKTSLVIGRTKQPLEWESLDGNPIDIIFLFAVKTSDSTTVHIKLLQKVATLLADDEVIQSLQSVKTKQELIKLLSKNYD
ncbi:PTS sugar transporter subunit IIA [Heyndrickxia shackletonii]|uniref:PTS sugar transporter subunit IIA n=1 Tax=Heyndrickxia shackletonii TaxID=157838 RepID=UPI00128F159C|nr:PTS sugar transporter subunit IIA [Heyndrickxia shackletonii]NEY99266.1 PTS sugar transporter subunit IIA [Heyndrickxia shackletonii]